LYVDISDTFKAKVRAFREHRSQTNTKISIGWTMYVKAIMAGWNHNCKFAEIFYRIPLD
jgi:LmbE family N-acetylglucosaminyl deacetylase